MSEVTLENINKHYDSLQVLFDVSHTVKDGEFIVYVGPSGCGKSTLLRAIAGLEDITSGSILIDGERVNDTPPAERGVAMVFQSYALYPHMTVRANMEFGLKVNKVNVKEREQRIHEAARVLQLEEYLDRKPGQLSGGQRQRVAIGRAIVKQPRVFLFDEPLSNLDAALRVQMRVELENLHKTLGSTMIYVTHDQVEAMTLADRIVVLNDGKTEQIGAPLDLYNYPETQFVAGFIGSPKMNFMQIHNVQTDGTSLTLSYGTDSTIVTNEFCATKTSNQKLTLGVRPEHLQIGNVDQADFKATIKTVEALGSETYVYADSLNGDQIIVRTQNGIQVGHGDTIGLKIEKGKEHLFDNNGQTLVRSDI